jgi:GTPase
MPQPEPLPVVVIVGRPNVGKSTLFNTITGERRAIVGNEPGITRDRIRGRAEHQGRGFELVDTGGIVVDDRDYIPSEILRQARKSLENAAHIVFLIDGRTAITSADRDLADMLRRLGRPVTLAVNKIDAPSREALALEFYELGIADVFPVSAEHRLGVDDMLDHVTRDFPRDGAAPPAAPKRRIRVAIIGRPNVGKSSLLNSLCGTDRAIVSPVAGTTRDTVDETVEREGAQFVFVDTAGIRRKGKTRLMAEKLSVVMARRAIRTSDVALLLLDATEGVLALDATIAGYAHEAGRAVILCVNKWDLMEDGGKRRFEQDVRDKLKFLEYAPVRFLSAKTGWGTRRLFAEIAEVYENSLRRVPTADLNRFLESLGLEEKYKARYLTQVGTRPPEFTLFLGRAEKLHFSMERYLVNQLRKAFGFRGTPVLIHARTRGAAKRGKRA